MQVSYRKLLPASDLHSTHNNLRINRIEAEVEGSIVDITAFLPGTYEVANWLMMP